jgi:hypothetical protein
LCVVVVLVVVVVFFCCCCKEFALFMFMFLVCFGLCVVSFSRCRVCKIEESGAQAPREKQLLRQGEPRELDRTYDSIRLIHL